MARSWPVIACLALAACGGRSALEADDGRRAEEGATPACSGAEAATVLVATGVEGSGLPLLQRLEPRSGNLTTLGAIDCPLTTATPFVTVMAWSRRGALYVGFTPAELYRLDLETLVCERVAVPADEIPHLAAFAEDPDGAADDEVLVGYLLAQGGGPGQRVAIYDPETLAMSSSGELAEEESVLGFGATGPDVYAVYGGFPFEVAPVDLDAPRIETESAVSFFPESSGFFFDATVWSGQLLYFASADGDTEVARVDLDTGAVEQLPGLPVAMQAVAALSCP